MDEKGKLSQVNTTAVHGLWAHLYQCGPWTCCGTLLITLGLWAGVKFALPQLPSPWWQDEQLDDKSMNEYTWIQLKFFLLLLNFLHHKGKDNCAKNSVTNNHKSKIYFPISVQCHMSDELTKWVRYTYLFYTSSVVIIYPIISAQQYIIMSWRIWHLELMVQMMQ